MVYLYARVLLEVCFVSTLPVHSLSATILFPLCILLYVILTLCDILLACIVSFAHNLKQKVSVV